MLVGVEERAVPALRPVERVAGEGHVDDARAVVDGPADGVGDLRVLVARAGGRAAERDRDAEDARGRGDADHAGSGAGAAAGEE